METKAIYKQMVVFGNIKKNELPEAVAKVCEWFNDAIKVDYNEKTGLYWIAAEGFPVSDNWKEIGSVDEVIDAANKRGLEILGGGNNDN